MKLSELQVRDCGVLNGERFIVTERHLELGGVGKIKRATGSTHILIEQGKKTYLKKLYLWDDEDPEVEYLGKGSYKITHSVFFPEKQ